MSTKEINQFKWTIMVALPATLLIIIKILYGFIKPTMLISTDDFIAVFLSILPILIMITTLVMAIILVILYIYCEISKYDTCQLIKFFNFSQEELFHKICILPLMTFFLLAILSTLYSLYITKYNKNLLNLSSNVILAISLIASIIWFFIFAIRKKKISKLPFRKYIIFTGEYVLLGVLVLFWICVVNLNRNEVNISSNLDENGVLEVRINSNCNINDFELKIVNKNKIIDNKFTSEDLFCSGAIIQSTGNDYMTQKSINNEYYKKMDLSEYTMYFVDNEKNLFEVNATINNRNYKYCISFEYINGKFYCFSKQNEVKY